jgi:hypothetical protein
MKHATQGRRLIAMLKRRGMTYREMLQATESTSPWRRVVESLGADEEVKTTINAQGWTVWRVMKTVKGFW